MLTKHGRSDIAPNAGATYGHLKPYRHTQAADFTETSMSKTSSVRRIKTRK
jgi:hypothetical protein